MNLRHPFTHNFIWPSLTTGISTSFTPCQVLRGNKELRQRVAMLQKEKDVPICSKTLIGGNLGKQVICVICVLDVSLILHLYSGLHLVPSHFYILLPLIPMLEDDLINSQRGFGGLRVLCLSRWGDGPLRLESHGRDGKGIGMYRICQSKCPNIWYQYIHVYVWMLWYIA